MIAGGDAGDIFTVIIDKKPIARGEGTCPTGTEPVTVVSETDEVNKAKP
jgi:hypothetical protein